MKDQQRINALPNWGDAAIPADQDQLTIHDGRGFSDIVRVFIRTWPYLLPMIIGYWREQTLLRSNHFSTSADGNWCFYHGPLLTTSFVVTGIFSGILPVGQSWQTDTLALGHLVMVVLCWALVFVTGHVSLGITVLLIIVGSAANLFAVLVVTGWLDNALTIIVTLGCLSMWLLQYRTTAGKLELRVRLGCHLVYYYAIVWLSTLVGIITGFFTIDLLNQSILQAQPLTPFLADFIGHPELAAGTVDSLSVAERQNLQWMYIFFLIAMALLMFPFTVVLPYYNVWIMQQINEELRLALVERWHQLSLRYHGDHRVGDSVYRIYQDSAQVTAIMGMVISILTQVVQYTVAFLFISALDPLLGLLVLSAAILALLWATWFSPRMRTRSLLARETNSDLTSRIQEILGAVSLVKISGTENTEQQRFESDSVVAFNAAYRVRSLVAIITIVMFTLSATILLGGEFMMALWASESRETFAAVLIALIGLSFVKWNLGAFQWAQGQQFAAANLVQGLLRQWTMAQDMAMGLERVFSILDIEPDVVNSPDAVQMPAKVKQIRFHQVGFGYESQSQVLTDVNFTASTGTITAIVGPTGSGKSTLMALLSRLFDPDTGHISVNDIDLRNIELDSLRGNVSIALQENILFAMSLRDNIRYVVPEADDDQVWQAARIACVDEYISSLPEGLDTVLGDRGGKLSTGQRQRLSIARAIVRDASILILDEPTAALDAQTEQKVLNQLAEWGRNRIILLITHRISTIQKADQILYLDQGRIIENGTHEQLMSDSDGRYRRFVDTEMTLGSKSSSEGKDRNDSPGDDG